MKRLLIIFSTILVVLLFVSCKWFCKDHLDENNDYLCDKCGTVLEKIPNIIESNVNVKYLSTHFTEEEAVVEYRLIKSKSDLIDFTNLNNLLDLYNDAFFENNGLIVFKNIETSQGNVSEIVSYSIDNGVITINVETKEYGEDCAMGYSYFILELENSRFNLVTKVKIIKNNQELHIHDFVSGKCECGKFSEIDSLEWNNDNAVYAYINKGYEEEILNNFEKAFEGFDFKKVYVTNKIVTGYNPLELLFVLNESGVNKQLEFIELLKNDERVYSARICRDLPFETVDTRYIECEKTTIAVGETLTLEVKGSIDYFVPPYEENGIYIQLYDYDDTKVYTTADFPYLNLKKIESITNTNGTFLYLELANGGYYNLIKSANLLALDKSIENVMINKNIISVIPPIWQVSDETIVEIVDLSNPKITIKGLLRGVVELEYAGVSIEITVE